MSTTAQPQVLLAGLTVGESPRWHDGRLWFANWGAQEIVALDLHGTSEVIAHKPGRRRLLDRLAARRSTPEDRA